MKKINYRTFNKIIQTLKIWNLYIYLYKKFPKYFNYFINKKYKNQDKFQVNIFEVSFNISIEDTYSKKWVFIRCDQGIIHEEKATEFLKVVPDSLESKDVNKFDIIVAMEKNHEKAILEKNPNLEDKILVWNIRDPYQLQFKQACQVFNQIKSKVANLAKGL